MNNQWEHKRVALLYGGQDSEREVSLKTGAAFRQALQELKVDLIDLDFDEQAVATLATETIDVALIALHGRMGEGGPVQGLLECLRIPYTGSGVLGSSLAMDKVAAKKLLRQAGVPTPAWCEPTHMEALQKSGLVTPLVAKPPCEGSSVGVTIVHKDAELEAALQPSWDRHERIMVEQYIRGREMSVGIFDGEVLGVMEIVPASGVYDFEAKYVRNDTQYLLPAPVSEQELAKIQDVAIAAWNAIGCRGVGRVDVLLDDEQNAWVLELNTVPGMTPTSIVPKMAKAKGWSFNELVVRMLNAARCDSQGGHRA